MGFSFFFVAFVIVVKRKVVIVHSITLERSKRYSKIIVVIL